MLSFVRASVTLLWHWTQALSPTFVSGPVEASLLPEPQPVKAAASSDKVSVAKKRFFILMLSPPSFVWLVGQ
jgi:hypothetical protein